MKDEYINGTNVKKFILPGQNHGASFSSNTDIAKCDAIRAALDAVFGAPQSIENTPFPSGDGWGEAHKFLRDGQILILRGNKTYTITGAEVRYTMNNGSNLPTSNLSTGSPPIHLAIALAAVYYFYFATDDY